jgi:cytosine/adenosine deaminase-related metal-dependent hydrolase
VDKHAIVVRGGLVLAPAGKCSLQDLLIEDGKIVAIDAPGFSVSADAEVVSAADRLLIPGLISSHTHSHGALNRGAVDDKVSLEMFLTGGASGAESRGVKDKYLSTALSAAEMIRNPLKICESQFRARYGNDRRMRSDFDKLGFRPALDQAGSRPVHSAALLGRIPDRMRASGKRIRRAAPDPSRRVARASVSGTGSIRQESGGTFGGP